MTEFFLILDHFLPFYPIGNTKNQNFEKMKKTPGDIIILYMCTINANHYVRFLRYGVQRTDFYVILDHFLYFYPENQNFEKLKKNTSTYYHFTNVYHK